MCLSLSVKQVLVPIPIFSLYEFGSRFPKLHVAYRVAQSSSTLEYLALRLVFTLREHFPLSICPSQGRNYMATDVGLS